MQLLRQPDAQPYEIVRLPENPLRHLTHCLSFLCVLTTILCVKYAVTPLNGNAAVQSTRPVPPQGICLFWTILYLIAISDISQVLEYSIYLGLVANCLTNIKLLDRVLEQKNIDLHSPVTISRI